MVLTSYIDLPFFPYTATGYHVSNISELGIELGREGGGWYYLEQMHVDCVFAILGSVSSLQSC